MAGIQRHLGASARFVTLSVETSYSKTVRVSAPAFGSRPAMRFEGELGSAEVRVLP
jgi:hypothetical protein